MRKMITRIPARRDGTVRVEVGETVYVFAPDRAGQLVAEVADADADKLLVSEQFVLPEVKQEKPEENRDMSSALPVKPRSRGK